MELIRTGLKVHRICDANHLIFITAKNKKQVDWK